MERMKCVKLSCALFLCFVSFFCQPLFARGGVLAGSSGSLSVIKTTYFDIIYPPASSSAAEQIAAVCDGYYEELCQSFLIEPCDHFPVTITHSVESLNASFSLWPYNHIILYDVPPGTSLDMNEQTIENVFYHELTHAVTGNIKNKRLRFWSGLIGDFLSPAFFSMTQFWIEGVAVEAESRGESGRLHDPYSTLLVLQAKQQGRFPSYRDVTGARDIYPGGTDAYMFGGLFSRYLCETYGREAYASYWKRLGYGKKVVPKDDLFFALTGKHMKETWKDFEAWLAVPACTEALDAETGSYDFFVASELSRPVRKTALSRTNNRLQLFSLIDTCSHGAVWYERKTGAVWYAAFDGRQYQKPKKLFTASSATRVAISDDGRYIAVSYLYDKRTVKTAVCVYDVQTGSLVTVPRASLRDAGFVRGADGSLLLCAVCFKQAPYTLSFYRVGRSARDFENVYRVSLADGEIPYTPVDAGNGNAACIVKKGLDWKIRVYAHLPPVAAGSDAPSLMYTEFGSEKTIIHNLHSALLADGRRAYSFSYAAMGASGAMFPRASLLYTAPQTAQQETESEPVAELVLQNDDISGGVLNVALSPKALCTGSEELLHVGDFYDTERLLLLDFEKRAQIRKTGSAPKPVLLPASVEAVARGKQGKSDQPSAAASDGTTPNAAASGTLAFGDVSSVSATSEVDALAVASAPVTSSRYNAFSYMKNGIFVPFMTAVIPYSETLSTTVATSDTYGVSLATAFLGATYVTANPWGDKVVTISAGESLDGYTGAAFELSGGDDTLSYAFSGTAIFDESSFTQTTETASVSHVLYARYGKTISAGASGAFLYGYGMHYDDDGNFLLTEEKDCALSGTLYTRFSTVHKRAPGYFQYGGVYAQPFLLASYTDDRCVNAGVTVGGRLPGLFPLSASVSLFPSADYCASGSVSAIVFSHEVQKAVPLFYADRVYLSAGYSAKLSYEHGYWFDLQRTPSIFQDVTASDYSDALQLKAGVITSINMAFLTYICYDISFVLQYRPNPESEQKKLAGGILFDVSY